MSHKELSPVDSWKIDFALFKGPRSPLKAAAHVEKIARGLNVAIIDAAGLFSEDMNMLLDPHVQRSLRQAEAGELEEISDANLEELHSNGLE